MSHRAPACLLICAALAVGCGGDDGKEARSAYIQQAEIICAKANADQKALTFPTKEDDFPPYVMKVVSIADTAATELRELPLPPKDVADLTAKVLDPLAAQVVIGKDYSAKVSAAARAKDQGELLRLLGNPPTETKADLRWMKSYGFSACIDAADTTN